MFLFLRLLWRLFSFYFLISSQLVFAHSHHLPLLLHGEDAGLSLCNRLPEPGLSGGSTCAHVRSGLRQALEFPEESSVVGVGMRSVDPAGRALPVWQQGVQLAASLQLADPSAPASAAETVRLVTFFQGSLL